MSQYLLIGLLVALISRFCDVEGIWTTGSGTDSHWSRKMSLFMDLSPVQLFWLQSPL
jgi:hypothetical protein